MPKVSVVMPVFNAERFLRKAVDSIVGQTFADWELILVDDGSTDGSPEILRSFGDPRVKVIRQENLGVSAALNAGIGLSAGEYVARMDADDIARPDRIATQARFLDENPDIDVVGGCVLFIDENGRPEGRVINRACSPPALRRGLLLGSPMAHPTVMFRRSFFDRFGTYNAKVRFAQDYELWARAAHAARYATIPEYLVDYRIHPESIGSARAEDQKALAREIHLSVWERSMMGDGLAARATDGFRWGRWTSKTLAAFSSGIRARALDLDLVTLLTAAGVAIFMRKRFRLGAEILAEALGFAAANPSSFLRILFLVSWRWRKYYYENAGVLPAGKQGGLR